MPEGSTACGQQCCVWLPGTALRAHLRTLCCITGRWLDLEFLLCSSTARNHKTLKFSCTPTLSACAALAPADSLFAGACRPRGRVQRQPGGLCAVPLHRWWHRVGHGVLHAGGAERPLPQKAGADLQVGQCTRLVLRVGPAASCRWHDTVGALRQPSAQSTQQRPAGRAGSHCTSRMPWLSFSVGFSSHTVRAVHYPPSKTCLAVPLHRDLHQQIK